MASFFVFFLFWHARTPDYKPDLREERHPFLVFFFFGMPGHLIISWIYAKSGILFGIFSVLACQGTLSQAGFTRRAASFFVFFSFGMPGHLIISRIYAASGILFGIFSFFACRGT